MGCIKLGIHQEGQNRAINKNGDPSQLQNGDLVHGFALQPEKATEHHAQVGVEQVADRNEKGTALHDCEGRGLVSDVLVADVGGGDGGSVDRLVAAVAVQVVLRESRRSCVVRLWFADFVLFKIEGEREKELLAPEIPPFRRCSLRLLGSLLRKSLPRR